MTPLRAAAAGMGASVAALAAAAVWIHLGRPAGAPPPSLEALRVVNLLTAAAMALAAVLIGASEAAWRRAKDPRSGFIVRTALREAAALAGGGVALAAAYSGALRAYPAYWANLVPAVLFASYLWAHWPDE